MKVNRKILPPGRIGLAVSGGSDSVANDRVRDRT